MSYKVFDADAHVQEPESMWQQYVSPRYRAMAPRNVVDNQGRPRVLEGGELRPYIPSRGGVARERRAGGYDPQARLKDMDGEGIEISVLYPSTGLPIQGIKQVDVLLALCQAYNNWLHDFSAVNRKRLVPMALVPQMDVEAAVLEARRCITELGFQGIVLRPNPMGGKTLDHPAFDPLWQLATELDVPVTIHEGTGGNIPMQAGRDRYDNFIFVHAVSHPHEQQMALMSLICGGVLERFPKLRVAFLESGAGWLAYWLERLDRHLQWKDKTVGTLQLPLKPSEYFARQCFIAADPDEAILPGVIQVVGDENILFATDYPHTDGIWPGVVKALADRSDISEASKEKIFERNPVRLYHFEK